MKIVYLDYAATTPVAQEVADTMAQHLTLEGNFANPASRSHRFGWQAEEAVESARITLAKLIGASNREIVWTSGATESNNLAIKGVAENFAPDDCHIITSATEHKAVLDPVLHLQSLGYGVTILKPSADGIVSAEQVADAMTEKTRLVSIMAVNNETGVINPIEEVGRLCQSREVYFHVDAAQAVGKIPVDVERWQVTLLSMSAHKFYGPKGVGALYVRRRSTLNLKAQIHGGGHERGMRSGTLPTHQIVGLGAAFALANESYEADHAHAAKLRQKLWDGLQDIEEIYLNGDLENSVPNIVNISFNFVEGESLMMSLKDLAVSSGSACTSATLEPSYVLRAIGRPDELAHSSIRFSFGRYTTDEDIDTVIKQMHEAVDKLRALSPLWDMYQEGVDLNSVEWAEH